MKKLTIFTPTYNRADEIEVMYNSLLRQSSFDFVWLIVDDGSKDNTEQIVNNWKQSAPFEIQYYKKENGGKHTTIDYAHQKCNTEYITCCDSDDFMTDNAVEVLLEHIRETDLMDNVAGVVSLIVNKSRDDDDKIIASENMICKYSKLEDLFGFYPETIIVLKTNIAKMFHFPKITDERFITEGVYYNPIFRKYDVYIIKEKVNVCKYLESGYTAQGEDLFFKNPKGKLYFLKQLAYFSIEDKQSFRMKVYNAAMYFAWAKALGIKDEFKEDYKIKFPYNVLGRIGKLKLTNGIRAQYNEYLQRRKK